MTTPLLEPDTERSRSTGCQAGLRRVLVLSTSFPSTVEPVYGVFVKERVRAVAALPQTEVRVVAPIPYFPPIKQFRRWYPFSQIARRECIDGLDVLRPRYVLPPKIGGYFHSELMSMTARRATRKLKREFEFDLIDSHFVYPTGVVAVKLGKRYRKPVIITGRGEEIARFPRLPIIGKRIRSALKRATQLVAVSDEIAEAMEKLGADSNKITVIPNGVDCEKFRPIPRELARRQLGLNAERPILLAVGYRLEIKGFHLLIDAIPKLRKRFPNLLVAIVGGQARWAADYLPEIEARIRANNAEEHVLLAGTRPQDELNLWYSAADLLSILSSREGSPNVLMEALACGLPTVATPVGGIPQTLNDARLGLLLPERSAASAAEGLTEALSQTWDRPLIRSLVESRSWSVTAKKIERVFDRAMADYAAQQRG